MDGVVFGEEYGFDGFFVFEIGVVGVDGDFESFYVG